jgi:hypothetical protein
MHMHSIAQHSTHRREKIEQKLWPCGHSAGDFCQFGARASAERSKDGDDLIRAQRFACRIQ